MKTRLLTLLKSLLLPLLIAAAPVVYVYARNTESLETINLRLPLGSAMTAAVLAFAVFLAVQRRPLTASLSAAVFMGFFHGYGHIYRWLIRPDTFTVEHFVLLPLALLVVFYTAVLISKLRPDPARAVQTILLVAAAALVTYNVVLSAGQELTAATATARGSITASAAAKSDGQSSSDDPAPAGELAQEGRVYPDVYYIVFDEYAGFNVLREYFKDNSVDDFERFLEDNGFFIAGETRSPTLSTLVELSSRLDLQPYTEEMESADLLAALRDNRTMRTFKEHGYTTIAIDMAFQSILADRSLFFDANQMGGLAVDAFQRKFIRDTMLLACERCFLDTFPSAEKQRDMIFESLEMTANQQDIDGPKFVFTHILLPHMPFIFDAEGNLLDPDYREDWNYYLGQYQYSTILAQELIEDLLAQAAPDTPPVIIFQSDHGARNISERTKDSERLFLNRRLENYSLSTYGYSIINALHLPGYDTSQLPDDLEPIKTFEIVLNHYLDAGVVIGE